MQNKNIWGKINIKNKSIEKRSFLLTCKLKHSLRTVLYNLKNDKNCDESFKDKICKVKQTHTPRHKANMHLIIYQ